MLCEEYYRVRLSEFDQEVFRSFVRPDHPHCPDKGQPAINPVLMLKLE